MHIPGLLLIVNSTSQDCVTNSQDCLQLLKQDCLTTHRTSLHGNHPLVAGYWSGCPFRTDNLILIAASASGCPNLVVWPSPLKLRVNLFTSVCHRPVCSKGVAIECHLQHWNHKFCVIVIQYRSYFLITTYIVVCVRTVLACFRWTECLVVIDMGLDEEDDLWYDILAV